ncbi:MAG TPA: sigma-54 dependent transcriptional regulator [Pyrinomonadaceae bacterium]
MGAQTQMDIPRGVGDSNSSHYKGVDNSKVVIARALRSGSSLSDPLREQLAKKLIGASVAMQILKDEIELVARSNEAVLVTGESGTGKELISRAIHDLSPRRSRAFVAINCGSLNESVLESELFGHVKGAFTGAITSKKGFFEAADGGTIFLDEFAEMSLNTQARLLRVLQEGQVRPVGSTDAKEIELDTRVVVATNHDLKRDIAEGKFRHDLYYRVNVLQIHSPALRERHEDILSLVQYFIQKYNERNGTEVSLRIPSDVIAVLEDYAWPGNVRELENIVKRLALTASIEGAIKTIHLRRIAEFVQLLSDEVPCNSDPIEQNQVSRKLNCLSRRKRIGSCPCNEELITYQQLVEEARGNVAAVARRLNIPRTTLRHRMMSLSNRCESR